MSADKVVGNGSKGSDKGNDSIGVSYDRGRNPTMANGDRTGK